MSKSMGARREGFRKCAELLPCAGCRRGDGGKGAFTLKTNVKGIQKPLKFFHFAILIFDLRYGNASAAIRGQQQGLVIVVSPSMIRLATISRCARLGKMGNTLLLFDEMPERDIPSWSAVIAGCTQNGLFLELCIRPLFGMQSGRDLVARFVSDPDRGAVCTGRDAELGLADLRPTGMFSLTSLE
ncbi:hypothetical protein U1Q18_001080 [Sarracenia purpurea var. burkii]